MADMMKDGVMDEAGPGMSADDKAGMMMADIEQHMPGLKARKEECARMAKEHMTKMGMMIEEGAGEPK